MRKLWLGRFAELIEMFRKEKKTAKTERLQRLCIPNKLAIKERSYPLLGIRLIFRNAVTHARVRSAPGWIRRFTVPEQATLYFLGNFCVV